MSAGRAGTARSENALAAVIDAYNGAISAAGPRVGTIELELRLEPVSAEEFTAIRLAATAKYGQAKVSRTCNIIASETGAKTRSQSQNIITYTHGGPVRMPPQYSTKTRLVQPAVVQRDGLNYRIGVAREAPALPMRVLHNALLRYKVRFSWDVPGENGLIWSLDMTIVKRANVNDGESILSAIRDEMFLPEIPGPEDATYEIEVELKRASADGRIRPADFNIIDTIIELIHPDHVNAIAYQRAVYDAATTIGVNNPSLYKSPSFRLKQLVPQVEAISRVTFRRLGSIIGHWATLKLDGERCLVHVNGSRCTIILADSVIEFTADIPMYGHTLADGEIIGCGSDSKKCEAFVVHLFDVVMIDDERSASDISARIASLPAACDAINSRLGGAGRAVPKVYVRLDNVERDISAVWNSKADLPVDGLIISEPNKPYMTTQHYKWKPTDQNTIDFMIIKCPDNIAGVAPYIAEAGETVYLLFVGIDHEMRTRLGIGFMRGYREMFPETAGRYYPIQFSPSVNPLAYIWHSRLPDLHGKIGEFSLSGARDCHDCEWVFHRVRNDRRVGTSYYGNNFYVAETIYMNYIDDFPLCELWGGGGDTYFTRNADERFRASNDYKRVVINALFGAYIRDASYVFDAAAGRGADLSRYRRISAHTLLAVDIDAAAIAELVDRKHAARRVAPAKTGGGLYGRFPTINGDAMLERDTSSMNGVINTTIYASVCDLSRPVDELVGRILRYGCGPGVATAFVCNFALHYFCNSEGKLRQFLTFAERICAPGARLIFTVMNGAAVEAAIAAGPWKVEEGGDLKYYIRFAGTATSTAAAVPAAVTKAASTTSAKPATKAALMAKVASAATSADMFGRMIEIKLPFTDKLMSEPLCYVDAVVRVARDVGLGLVQTGGFEGYNGEFERNNAVMHATLTDGDRAYIAMHSYIVLEKSLAPHIGVVKPVTVPVVRRVAAKK